ncbi:MAG: hypothetical protein ACI9R3_006523 [Verrucomicrobiales bacterium]|jgi:hypothetical protein
MPLLMQNSALIRGFAVKVRNIVQIPEISFTFLPMGRSTQKMALSGQLLPHRIVSSVPSVIPKRRSFRFLNQICSAAPAS